MTLTIERRHHAIALLKAGFSSREVAEKLGNVDYTSILRLKKKYGETGQVENKEGQGRKRILEERNERVLIRRIMTDEAPTVVALQKSLKINEKINVSANTIRRALKRHGMMARVKRKKLLLFKTHHHKRLAFAKKYMH